MRAREVVEAGGVNLQSKGGRWRCRAVRRRSDGPRLCSLAATNLYGGRSCQGAREVAPSNFCAGDLIIFSCSPVSRAVPWSAAAVKGAVSLDRGEHRGMLGGGGDQNEACRGRPVAGDVRVRATRGQIRLIYAGWLPQDGLFGWSTPLV